MFSSKTLISFRQKTCWYGHLRYGHLRLHGGE